ncbi:peptidase [Bifidobacteriaceae bacterium NR002]|nr:peptidase [Bifidobacteriaceae bacterium NR002]MDZ7549496.1 peptidase [Bifidobacteriaceae bacterium NR047]
MANSNSRRHARKVTLDAALSNAIAKAVDARKVAAFTVGAAGVLAGAAFAFGATPAMAAEAGAAPDTKPAAVADTAQTPVTTGENAGENADAGKKASAGEKGKDAETGKSDKKDQTDLNKEAGDQTAKKEDVNKLEENKQTEQSVVNTEDKTDVTKTETTDVKATSTYAAAGVGTDRASNNDAASQDSNKIKPDTTDTTNTKINIDENNAGTMPNMYGWGSSDNTFSEGGEKHTVTFHFAAPKDGGKITNIAIFPAQNNGLTNDKSKRGAEYYSGDPKMRQSFSGNYTFKQKEDGSATLEMSDLFSIGKVSGGAEKYVANRSIFVYVTKNGKEDVAYKTNAFRAATIVTPKTSGSVVLKYDQPLTKEQIQSAITTAANAETTRSDKMSVNDQIVAASKAKGVNTTVNGKSTQVPDTLTDKINASSADAYDKTTFEAINKETSAKDAKDKTYVAGAKTLNTYMVTDLGFKSQAIPLTVARYDDRIEKPIVEDPTQLSPEVKEDIKKKLAKINGVSSDKITFDNDGNAVINFDGVDAKDAPKIKLSDLVLKKFKEDQITVPANDKAVFVANPLGYSTAELDRIKTAIYEANKENKDLGLTSKDQISLEYLTGDLTGAGKANQGISNGMAENKITVKIKTDKAVAEFTSDIKASKLTKLPNIREDYDVSWTKDKLDNRNTDEGFSWSADKKTIIYRYDPTKAVAFKSGDVTKLLTATPKTGKEGLRVLNGDEQLGHEGEPGKEKKSHVYYVIDSKGEPTGALTLGIMNSGYWKGDIQITGTETNMGDLLAKTGTYKWDEEAKPVELASKDGKIYRARLFVAPYGMETYQHVYTFPDGKNPNNTTKAINVIFVPQTNHKKADLSKSLAKYTTTKVEGKDVPTQPAYYNASADKKKAYDDALSAAKETLKKVGTKADADLSEDLKAEVDNATIALNKAREALDGDKTNKDGLNTSIEADGTPAKEGAAATGTQATNQFKNVSEPDFKKADGSDDTDRNNAAKAAKTAYDKALEEAKKLKDDANATQKAVDEAKAKLDAAREKLNEFSTNKDKLNAAIAEHGKVKTGDADKQGDEKLKTADPTYQNASTEERNKYDEAVKKAKDLSADPNASQKEVNDAITALEKAKKALDAKATDKSQLITAEKLTFDNPDNDANKQSTFYKNALNKQTNGANDQEKQAAKTAVDNYNNALTKAREVLKNDKATQKEVNDAKDALTNAEKVLHEKYATNADELTKVLADNFSGYLMPAYFNAFDKAHAGDKDAATAFKNYNDAYQKAKELKKNLEDAKTAGTAPDQKLIDEAKTALENARKVIDKYATNTSRLSAAVFNDLAIKNSPAYKNVSEADASADAKAAKDRYDKAVEKLHQALNKNMPKDKQGNTEIPTSNPPEKNIDVTNADALKNIQAHAQGEPLDRDVDAILKEMNAAAAELNKFATKTDELLKSVNEDDATKHTPAYKNASLPVFQKADSSDADADKNAKAKQAVDKYGEMLNKAKELLVKVDATQEEVNKAKKDLDDARKTLLGDPNDQANVPGFNTDVTKLQKSVGQHGKEKQGDAAATEGTVTSDAYRNASDPHFMKADANDPSKLVEDTEKNKQAVADKKAYDDALTKAQELLKKHDSADTPQDAKPTQAEINDALKALDEARTKLDDYKTNAEALKDEAAKSTADGSIAGGTDFENMPEFKNADAKKGEDNEDNDDVKAYKDALKNARDLVKAATEQGKKNSERPTQQQINDALEALKNAKKQITDNYKTDAAALKDAKDFANGAFKKTPEYKNAVALKDDASAAPEKKNTAKADVDAIDKNTNDSALEKAIEILRAFDDNGKPKQEGLTGGRIPTQKEVDEALQTLQKAMDKVTNGYKTNADKLNNEVGDKDDKGKDVIPPFEASVAYKNALEKAKTETGDAATTDGSATKKLEDYNKKLKAAQDLIAQVNSTDPNADPDKKPTQAQVDKALQDLKDAKTAIDNAFKTNASALKNEADDKDERGNAKQEADKFENSTEYKNALAKKTGDEDIPDVKEYKEALKKAQDLLKKFSDDGSAPKQGATDVPTQQEVDEAQKALKEIKDKILKNYVTSPHDLQQEFDKSKDGADDNRNGLFEDTPAFKNAEAAKGEGGEQNSEMKAYTAAFDKVKKLLEAFDPATGEVKKKLPKGMDKAPTQKDLDDALKELQKAKKAIEDKYSTSKYSLRREHDADTGFKYSPEFINATDNANANPADESAKYVIENYKKALWHAESVLGDPDATQAEVDEALRRLQDAKDAITRKYATDKKNLKNEHDSDGDFENSPEFQNAIGTPEADAYKKAFENAKKVLDDPSATQAQVDEALRKLREAKEALVNGHKTNKADLQNEADDDPAFRNGISYLIAGSTDAEAYKKALDEARRVLSNPNATQAQVDEALRKLREAKQRIVDKFNNGGNGNGFDGYVPNAGGHEGDGYANNANANAVDKSALQAEINSALNVRGNSAAAQAYKNALAEAKRVLADANATQAQVDAAVKQLRDAKAAFNGFGGSDHHLAKTGAGVGLFAGLAAIFAGFGAAGVASRRRKHSNE